MSNLPIPREISARLFAAKGDRAIKELQRTLSRWIQSGGYKSAPPGTQAPIDAMAEGGLSVADQAAGCVVWQSLRHLTLQHDRPAARRALCDASSRDGADSAANSIRAIAWLFIYTLQSPSVVQSLYEDIAHFRASSEAITAAGLPSRVPRISSAYVGSSASC